MTTPRGAPELASAQALPETTVNEQVRHTEAGAGFFPVVDKDLTAPPGTCADGASYIIAATATDDWAGKEDQIATAVGTNAASGWLYHTELEGYFAYVQDENKLYYSDGSAWAEYTASGSGASTTQTGEQISGFIASPSDKSYTIAVKMAHAGTITETTTISASGTCTATFKVNTTALGGTANSVSSAEQSQTHSGTNTFSAGDDIVLTVSSNSSCADMSFTIKYTRTLD